MPRRPLTASVRQSMLKLEGPVSLWTRMFGLLGNTFNSRAHCSLTEATKAAAAELHDAGLALAITSDRPPRGMIHLNNVDLVAAAASMRSICTCLRSHRQMRLRLSYGSRSPRASTCRATSARSNCSATAATVRLSSPAT